MVPAWRSPTPGWRTCAEDADLCLRARAQGARPRICSAAEIVHLGGASEKVRAEKMVRLFRAKARLFRKHWRPAAARFGTAMLSLWAFSRMAAHRVLRFISGPVGISRWKDQRQGIPRKSFTA